MSSALGCAILAVVVTGFMGVVTAQRVDFGRLDSKIDGQGDKLRAEMGQLGGDLRAEIGQLGAELRTEMGRQAGCRKIARSTNRGRAKAYH